MFAAIQVRQTVQYASLHGGRVTWDNTCYAFAMAVDPDAPIKVPRCAFATNVFNLHCCLASGVVDAALLMPLQLC